MLAPRFPASLPRTITTIGLIVSLSVLAACRSTAPAPVATNDLPTIAFEKYTLPNGLDVILSEDHRLPLVAVNIWYHVGPANEAAGRTGFAHLFEHMMFQGSKHAPGDSLFKLLEGAGATGMNGTTDYDRTNYFETVPANELELALWLESDRMGFLLENVTQENLSGQQDVVRNERRQSVENRPYGIVDEAVNHLVYPQGHPYYASIIGSHADIQAAKLEDVRNFFKSYYAPNNASLAIVGDFDAAKIKALVEKYFGSFKKGPDVAKPVVEPPKITSERRQVVTDRVELPRVTMTWVTPAFFAPGDADADIASAVLGQGRPSRLYKALVYERQIAQTVSASQQSLSLGSMFAVEATARPGHTADELEQALNEELTRLRENGPDQEEVDRVRNVIETRLVEGLENLGGFGGVADRLNTYNHYLKDPGYLPKDIQRYRDVTPASVKAFVQQYLVPNARVVVHAVPGAQDLGQPVPTPPKVASKGAPVEGEGLYSDEPWRAQRPTAAAMRALTIPVPAKFELSNGLTVLVNERPGLPIVSANLVVKTGSGANPVDRPGLANFTAAMLDEGTATRTALQIADQAAQLGGSLTTGSGVDSSQISGTALARTFPAMLTLMADVARRPTFPQEEIDRQRASRLAQIVQQRESANAVASTVMAKALYGEAHPYGYQDLGTEASNKAIDAAQMKAFWAQNFVPNNAALIVSGRISAAELRPLVEQLFGDWQKGTPVAVTLPTPTSTASRLVIVDKPGSPQTQLRVATIGAARATPDYEALRVMNETLGGLFSSRININLREDHGYTYGASSQFVFRRAAGPFTVATGVRTDVTAPAVFEILKELERMAKTDVTSDELTLSRDSFVRSLPADFETSRSVSASTANLYVYDLGLDYFSTLASRIGAVTADQVRTVAQTYLPSERMVVIAVGDRAKIQQPLERLGLGKAELRSPEGAVTK